VWTLAAVTVSLVVVDVLQTTIVDPQVTVLLHLVRVVLAASRRGLGTRAGFGTSRGGRRRRRAHPSRTSRRVDGEPDMASR
jgi:hypothetical protein